MGIVERVKQGGDTIRFTFQAYQSGYSVDNRLKKDKNRRSPEGD